LFFSAWFACLLSALFMDQSQKVPITLLLYHNVNFKKGDFMMCLASGRYFL